MDKISSWSCRKSNSGNSDNTWSFSERTITPAGNLACRFSKGVRSRSRIYKTYLLWEYQLHTLRTCDEPAFIFSGPGDSATLDIATVPVLGKVEVDVDQRPLFTDSIADWFRNDGADPKCRSYVDPFSSSSQFECMLEPGILTLTFSVR